MKIKLDENMPNAMCGILRSAGHDVSTVVEENLAGANDDKVLRKATEEERLLMTFDLDFADIREYPLGSHAGIVVFRLKDQRWCVLKELVENLLSSGALKQLGHGLAVVDDLRIRFRAKK